MSDYRIDIKVRNNIILYKLKQAGYETISEFCRVNNAEKYISILSGIVSMTKSPLKKDEEFNSAIKYLAEKLNCSELDLFNESQMNTVLQTNKKSIAANEAEMKFMLEYNNNDEHLLLEDQAQKDQFNEKILEKIEILTPREQKIIRARFGMDGSKKTLKEVGKELGISSTRTRQIECQALRKLRHPMRSKELREFLEEV